MRAPAVILAALVLAEPCRAQASSSSGDDPRPLAGLDATSFPFEWRQGSFEFGSDLDQPFESLASLAERSLSILRPWIGRGSKSRLSKEAYRVYLCDDVERIRDLEKVFKIPRIDPDQGRQVTFRGGFYPSAGMIAIPSQPGEDMRWDLVHEIGHAVYSEFLLGYLISIGEGICEYAAERMVEDEPGAELVLRHRRDWLLDECRQAVEAGLPSLHDFVPLGHWEFLDERVRSRNYALAWSLVRFLNRSEDPEVVGRWGDFMQLMARRARPWQAFQEIWDVDRIDPLWQRYVAGIARWTPVYGEWTIKDAEIEARVAPGSSSWALWRQRPQAATAFSISFRLPQDLSPELGLGFIIGQEDWENFVVAELRPGNLLAVISRDDGRWSPAHESPLPRAGKGPAGKTFRLDCAADGSIRLWLDSELILEKKVGDRSHAGWFGLFSSRPKGEPGDEPLAAHFTAVSVRLR